MGRVSHTQRRKGSNVSGARWFFSEGDVADRYAVRPLLHGENVATSRSDCRKQRNGTYQFVRSIENPVSKEASKDGGRKLDLISAMISRELSEAKERCS